jgi:uncharacterized protein YjbI with pentapeptide repeats
MANPEHLDILKQGVEAWNNWRKSNPEIIPDLSSADLAEENLPYINFSRTDLNRANLDRADLNHALADKANLNHASVVSADLNHVNFIGADLSYINGTQANLFHAQLDNANLQHASLREANLEGAYLSNANLSGTDLSKANLDDAHLNNASLIEANLSNADLGSADLRSASLHHANLEGAWLFNADCFLTSFVGANLDGASLQKALLIRTDLSDAVLTDCDIFGVSVWQVKLNGANQKNLRITLPLEPMVTVDDLQVAQFIHLLLSSERIRDVINTITSKAVLILGRFTPERKAVLNAIREELHKQGYLPILFDFDKPATRDITETVTILAGMSRFVIADITDAKSIPQELKSIVPNFPSVPVQPLLLASEHEYGMFEHFRRFPWVLEPYLYNSPKELIIRLREKVITPAEAKASELEKK